ncbi:nitrilase [Opitutaceae bacterium TAV5]|nr:nitrilase [Opitutaceae bacterium TAV5]
MNPSRLDEAVAIAPPPAPVRKPGRRVTVSAVGGPSPEFPPALSEDCGRLAEVMAAHWEREIAGVLPDRPDLIVLPEMCDRFAHTPPALLEKIRPVMLTHMTRLLSRLARENRCYIVHATAAPVPASGTYPGTDDVWQNVAILIGRDGREVARYAKNWLVVTETGRGLVPGAGACVAECDFGRVGFAICFDLNFPELLESYRRLRPDLIVFPSHYHGGFLQPVWAYETRAHFLGCMGMAGINSELWSPLGMRLAASTHYCPQLTATLNPDCVVAHLDFNQEKLRALKARYGRDVTITDPGQLGSVLITSNSETLGAADMAREFRIELLDDYLARSRRVNHNARKI